jgi:hypothetical protein
LVEKRSPSVSVVVVVYNMDREAPRTLLSLSANYQRFIDADDYEVIVVDNGSNPPFDPKVLESLSGNFTLIRIDPAPPSPAQAINRGLAEARGDIIGVMIDGARLVTPGLLHFARHGAYLYDQSVVATLGWYLGHDYQTWSIECGYNRAREDALLESIDWPKDGYRLFEIGAMDESSVDGWLQPISESNALFMRRELWELLGGFDENFDAPGGGLVNLDTFRRALSLPDAELVILLGEASFHQVHAGINTNAGRQCQIDNFNRWANQYQIIRGQTYELLRPKHPPTYIGTLPRPALERFVWTALSPNPVFEPPLGAGFNKELWTQVLPRSTDQVIAGLVDIAENEFRKGHFAASCAVARLTRKRAPDEPAPHHLVSLASPWLEDAPRSNEVEHHLALAEAHRLLGENEEAVSNYQAALSFNQDLPQAHLALSRLRMPGDDYLVWLDRLYTALAPETVIEIGVFQGESLARVPPPAVAIGIDPTPSIIVPLKTETHIFTQTSDEFFAQRKHEQVLAGRPLSIGFIDGLHLFEQALRDFIYLEACCGPRSVILIHDTVPLDEPTQTRDRNTVFHTGDVWRVVLCLKEYRPDLDIFTIATPPTGLTVVSGLDSKSNLLKERLEEARVRFLEVPFSTIESAMFNLLNVVPNDWSLVQSRLKDRGIL